MNNKFRRDRDYRDDRFRNDPQYTRGREPDGGFWERGEEDRVLRSPDQEFETSGSYRQPGEDYNQGRGSARYGSGGNRNQLTDYSSSSYDRNREGAYGGRESNSYGSSGYGGSGYGGSSYGSSGYGGSSYGSPGYGSSGYGSPGYGSSGYGGSGYDSSGRSSSSSSRGGFAGRGPKGYVRTDERIREEVCDRLSWNDEVDATDVTVLVEKGEVTLEGSVATRHMKRLAEDIAEDVPGVLDVHNTIRVQKPMLTELKEKITGEDKDHHYANTGTKTTGATSTGGGAVRNGVT